MDSKHATGGVDCQGQGLDTCAVCTYSLLVLATGRVESHHGDVANTLPTDTILHLIDDTAAALSCCPLKIWDTLDSLPDRDITDVLEAMQDLGTSDTDTLTAYLGGVSVLDDSLDGWLLDEVG